MIAHFFFLFSQPFFFPRFFRERYPTLLERPDVSNPAGADHAIPRFFSTRVYDVLCFSVLLYTLRSPVVL